VPLIKGGQGRRRDEVEASMRILCLCGIVLMFMGVALYVGLR